MAVIEAKNIKKSYGNHTKSCFFRPHQKSRRINFEKFSPKYFLRDPIREVEGKISWIFEK